MAVSTIERRRAIWQAAALAESGDITRSLVPDRRNFLSEMRVAMLPDKLGNSGPAINAALQELSTYGGGILYLGNGNFETEEEIRVPSRCGIDAYGKEAAKLLKAAKFPDGGTLVNMAGTEGDATGGTHRTGMMLRNLQLSAGNSTAIRDGLLLNGDFISTSRFDNLRLSGSPSTALSLRETWDTTFYDLSANNCGGPLGESDAVIRILGSTNDKSNLVKFEGQTRIETFRNMGVFVSDGGAGANSGPYQIKFASLKLESSILVNNATLFKSTLTTSSIVLPDVYLQFTAPSARTGLRGIDLDGGGHFVGVVQYNVGANVAVVSILKIPRNSAGGIIQGPVRGTGASTLTQILEADALRSDGFNVVYGERAMRIGTIVPFGTVPLIGGSGVDSAGYVFPQLDGTVSRTITANSTVRRSDLNRILAANNASTTTPIQATLPPEGDRFGAVGDTGVLRQVGAGAATLVGYSGVTLQVPAGLSATTAGQYTEVRYRKLGTNLYTVY